MEIIYQQDPRLVHWLNKQLDLKFLPGQVYTISCIEGDQLLCVVVYSRFSVHGCEMTIASTSPKWCSKRFLREAFAYPFLHCGYQRVTFVTTPDNHQAMSLNERLGAKLEGTLRKWFGDKDGLVYGLLKEECRWIT